MVGVLVEPNVPNPVLVPAAGAPKGLAGAALAAGCPKAFVVDGWPKPPVVVVPPPNRPPPVLVFVVVPNPNPVVGAAGCPKPPVVPPAPKPVVAAAPNPVAPGTAEFAVFLPTA